LHIPTPKISDPQKDPSEKQGWNNKNGEEQNPDGSSIRPSGLGVFVAFGFFLSIAYLVHN
jgi:hypothetical protein